MAFRPLRLALQPILLELQKREREEEMYLDKLLPKSIDPILAGSVEFVAMGRALKTAIRLSDMHPNREVVLHFKNGGNVSARLVDR